MALPVPLPPFTWRDQESLIQALNVCSMLFQLEVHLVHVCCIRMAAQWLVPALVNFAGRLSALRSRANSHLSYQKTSQQHSESTATSWCEISLAFHVNSECCHRHKRGCASEPQDGARGHVPCTVERCEPQGSQLHYTLYVYDKEICALVSGAELHP